MAGFVCLIHSAHDKNTLDAMLDTIAYRGKDYRLDYADDYMSLSYLGMDLSYKYDRKELFESENLVVLLNGYLKNVGELSRYCREHYNLEANTKTPAEIIAFLYEKEGPQVSAQLKGGFIVVIYEKNTKKLVLIRDRFGVQPVFYYQTQSGLLVASEAKALLPHPEFKKEFNKEALVPYLVFQAPVGKESFFKNVFSPAAASYMTYDGTHIEETSYWDIKFEEKALTLEEASNKINQMLEESIETSMSAFHDRDQIGQSLSGGVDSSYLASRFKPKRTFTVGYDNKEFSEIDNARALSEIIGAEHITELIDSEKVFTELDDIVYKLDMPLANLSAIPMYYLSKKISNYTHVVLSGEGSDEIFGGYFEYTEPKYMNLYKKLPLALRKFIGNKMLNNPRDFKGKNFAIKGMPVEDYYIGQAKIFHENEARNIVKKELIPSKHIKDFTNPYFDKVKNLSDIQKKQYLDIHVWMINDIALKADRMNIGNSVQLVTPILDEDLFDFGRTLPDKLKVDGSQVKVAFREAAKAYLPQNWANRKKLGYVVPLKYWLKEPKYRDILEETLTGDLARQFFDVDAIKQLLTDNESGKRPEHRKIWTLYMFLRWYEEYFVKR